MRPITRGGRPFTTVLSVPTYIRSDKILELRTLRGKDRILPVCQGGVSHTAYDQLLNLSPIWSIKMSVPFPVFPRSSLKMPFQRASQALSRYTVLDLTLRPLWADLRAAARGLGGQCHQDRRADGGCRRRAAGRAAPRFRLRSLQP